VPLGGSPRFRRTLRGMADKGSRFKLAPGRKPCPTCWGSPPLVLRDGRLVPDQCGTCDGRGSVQSEP
jgi:hypothetical protein